MTLPSVLAEPPITDLPPDPTYENADEVRRRAMFWAGKAGAGGKAAHAELIRQALVDPVKVRAAIGRLSQLDHTILSVVARYGGCTHASIVTLEVPMPGDLMRRGHHFDPPVRNLTRLGVLVDASGSSDSWSYDLTFGRRGWLALQPAIASELVPAVAPIVDVSGLQAEAMSGAVGRSAVEAFDEARNVARTLATLQPVKLTKAGALLRPLFDKLTKRLPALANEEAGYPPDRAAFVVASLRAIGVVRYAAGQPLSVDDAALRRISAGAPAAITHTLLRGWLNASSWADGVGALRGEDSWSYRGDDILAARRSVVWHLGALARGGVEWCSLRRLLERIYASGAAARHMLPRVARVPPFIMALASRTLQHLRETTFESWLVGAGTAYASMLIDTLPSLGVIEAAGRADGDIALRLTDAGRIAVGAPELQPAAPAATTTGPCLVVQPNDDVLVYLDDADRETLHLLATIADRAAGGDRVQTYRLSKETPMRAAEHGLDIDQLLAWLTVRARYPLPSRVSITLREWAANVRAVTMIKDVALTFGAPPPPTKSGAPPARDWGPWTVHPSGQLETTPSTTALDLCRLQRVATHVGGARWKIDATTVALAMARGMTGPQILDEVRGRRVSALPDRLEVAIEGWCGSRRPLRATTAWVITCDPKALRALRTVDLESIGAHIDPPFIWVPLDRKDDFTAVLREMGVAWVDGPTP